ncbi:MAG: hypothetical protein EOM68_06440 [Spirochaetia bacterium]|nr:hypothetical protein [Spirochaetia bacterium]
MKKLLLFVLSSSLLLASCQSYQATRFAGRGYEQLQARDFAAAGASFSEASAKDRENHTYRYNYLLSLFLQGQYDQVITLSEKAFDVFDFNLSFLLLKAQAHAQKEEYSKALETYERLFSLDRASYEIQADVMEAALTWGETDTARHLALGLLPVKAYEKRALTVLSRLSGENSWYALALSFLTKEGQTQDRQ